MNAEPFPNRADLVVAGGGIVGLSLAWQAAERGLAVVLLEKGRLGGSTSAGTFAWVNASSKTGAEAYHALNAGGLARYEALAAAAGAAAIGLGGAGSLQFVERRRPDLHAQLRTDFAALRGFGYPVAWLDSAAIRRRLPDLAVTDDTEGLLAPADRWLEVPRFLAWILAALKARGGRVLEHCPLVAVERNAAGAIRAVETPGGRIATSRLAAAAGIDTPSLLSLASGGAIAAERFPMRRVPGFLLESPPLPLATRLDLVLWSPDPAGIHLRQTAAGGLLLGADDLDALVGEGGEAAAIAEARRLLWQRAKAWLPGLDTATLDAGARWRIGRRAMPADGHSIVGPLAAVPGLFVAVTHSGVTLAPWIGELLAGELAGGAPHPALAPFRPARFGL
jgi:glycine/D-amino acid oxidase-like deaminating enzyme